MENQDSFNRQYIEVKRIRGFCVRQTRFGISDSAFMNLFPNLQNKNSY